MSDRTSLLSQLQRLLQRTYRLQLGSLDAARFVIGDRGYRALYGRPKGAIDSVPLAEVDRDAPGKGARTLVREDDGGLRASMYLPDRLVRHLEAYPPQHGVGAHNVDAFATLVEELDHLLCIADRAAAGRSLSLFELELHANVSKYLVLARFLAGRRGRLDDQRRVWLRYALFEKIRFSDQDLEVRARYRDAARWAVRFLDGLDGLEPSRRIRSLRRFHDETAQGKLRLIERLAA